MHLGQAQHGGKTKGTWHRQGLLHPRQRVTVMPTTGGQFRLHQRQSPGWFSPVYEELYSSWARHAPDGQRYLFPEALDDPVQKCISIGDGRVARFTLYPHRAECLQRTPKGDRCQALPRVTTRDLALRLIPRPVPYARYQGLLVTDTDEPQRMDTRRLTLCLLFAQALGYGWMVMFNKGGMTKNRFHAQFFKETTPLFDAIESNRLTVAARHAVGDGTVSARVVGWPVETSLLVGTSASNLARSVIALCDELEASRLTYDLAFRYSGSALCALVLWRKLTAMDHLKITNETVKNLGSLGTLELSGWVVSIGDPAMFMKLMAAPSTLAGVYLRALREVTATGDAGRGEESLR